MTIARTDMRTRNAKALRFQPGSGLISTNVEDAIIEVQGTVTLNGTTPPTLTPKKITFASSPYTMLGTDYLIEVDTTGGAVTIVAQSGAARSKEVTIKDTGLAAGTNAITVTLQGAEKVDNQSPYIMDSDGVSAKLQPNGVAGYTVIS